MRRLLASVLTKILNLQAAAKVLQHEIDAERSLPTISSMRRAVN
jgi:hypothetical protein